MEVIDSFVVFTFYVKASWLSRVGHDFSGPGGVVSGKFDPHASLESNGDRTAVESKSNLSCNHGLKKLVELTKYAWSAHLDTFFRLHYNQIFVPTT